MKWILIVLVFANHQNVYKDDQGPAMEWAECQQAVQHVRAFTSFDTQGSTGKVVAYCKAVEPATP